MDGKVTKQFSTIETLSLMLQHRDVMFETIETIDKQSGSGILENDFLKIVAKHQKEVGREVANKMALVFDNKNLLQARVLDTRNTDGYLPRLWFNANIIEVFRLCQISLFRPLTGHGLNAAMSPIWSIQNQLKNDKLTISLFDPEYQDWKDELNNAIASLLGRIKANVAKLQRIGGEFDKDLGALVREQDMDFTKIKYQEASRVYAREIKPLSLFLDKATRYENGDGIQLTLGYFVSFFDGIGDIDASDLMLSYQIRLLDLFPPIKAVASEVSVFLQKTKTSIFEHSAIERAIGIIRKAYEKTLSRDQRMKFINNRDLTPLGPVNVIANCSRLASFKTSKSPSFLNNVFNELADRRLNGNELANTEILEATISRKRATKLKHSFKIKQWTHAFKWPTNEDYIAVAHQQLDGELDEFTLPDLVEIGSLIHTRKDFNVITTNAFKTLETSTHKLRYRVRLLTPRKAGE